MDDVSGPLSGLRLVFAALAGEDRSGAVHRARTSHEADNSMTMSLTRRAALKAGAGGALATLVCRPFAALADDSVETHGLSSFGDLALPAGLPAFLLRQPERADRRPVVAADHRNERQPELRHLRHAQYLFLEGQRRGRHVGHLRHADDRQWRRTRFRLRPARAIRPGLGRQARLPLPAAPRGALLGRLEGHGGRCRLFAQRAEGEGPSDLRPAPEGGGDRPMRKATTSCTCVSSRAAAATRI